MRLVTKTDAVCLCATKVITSPLIAWFSTKIIGIIPMERGRPRKTSDPLQPCCQALDRGNILILFPEGSRGEPEQISQFKKGVAHLAERYPQVPVIPVFIHGLGKALPKGDFVLVPFFVTYLSGSPLKAPLSAINSWTS